MVLIGLIMIRSRHEELQGGGRVKIAYIAASVHPFLDCQQCAGDESLPGTDSEWP